jgi:STE24 endopeptidase
LAASLNFPLYKLYVVEGSKRSSHSNAYMYGFHKNKRIVLFDSLIEGYTPIESDSTTQNTAQRSMETIEEKSVENSMNEKEEISKGCSTPEIIAILAHELGNWKLNQNIKNLIINEVGCGFIKFLNLYLI